MTYDPTTIITYDHDDFLVGVSKIVTQIKNSDWTPDYIVGIVRGGAVPAVYLSHRLKVPVRMVQWNTRDRTTFMNDADMIVMEDLYHGKKVLLVDDIVDGGETVTELLNEWRQAVKEGDTMNVKVASLVYNTSQEVTVDFFHQEIDREVDSRWVVFPWE